MPIARKPTVTIDFLTYSRSADSACGQLLKESRGKTLHQKPTCNAIVVVVVAVVLHTFFSLFSFSLLRRCATIIVQVFTRMPYILGPEMEGAGRGRERLPCDPFSSLFFALFFSFLGYSYLILSLCPTWTVRCAALA